MLVEWIGREVVRGEIGARVSWWGFNGDAGAKAALLEQLQVPPVGYQERLSLQGNRGVSLLLAAEGGEVVRLLSSPGCH